LSEGVIREGIGGVAVLAFVRDVSGLDPERREGDGGAGIDAGSRAARRRGGGASGKEGGGAGGGRGKLGPLRGVRPRRRARLGAPSAGARPDVVGSAREAGLMRRQFGRAISAAVAVGCWVALCGVASADAVGPEDHACLQRKEGEICDERLEWRGGPGYRGI